EGPGDVIGLAEAGRHGRAEADVSRRGGERRDQRGRLEPAQEGRVVSGIHDEAVGHEHQVELAALGLAGDLLDDRQVVVAGRRALVAPSGGVIAGTEHEHAEVHLTSRRRHVAHPLRDNLPRGRVEWRGPPTPAPRSLRMTSGPVLYHWQDSIVTLTLNR